MGNNHTYDKYKYFYHSIQVFTEINPASVLQNNG